MLLNKLKRGKLVSFNSKKVLEFLLITFNRSREFLKMIYNSLFRLHLSTKKEILIELILLNELL